MYIHSVTLTMCTLVVYYTPIHAKQGKADGSTQGRQLISKKKLNCPEQDSNPRSLAYMTSALTTKPPRQLSGRGINPGIIKAM